MMNNVIKNFVMGDVTGLVNQAEQAKAAAGHKAEGAAAGAAGAVSPALFTEEVKKFIVAAKEEAERKMSAQTVSPQNQEAASNDINTTENAVESTALIIKNYDVSELQSKTKQGNDIIAQALIKVSELLNLPEGATLDPEELLSFESEDMTMFADVLWALDTVIKLFEKVSNDPAQLAEFVENSMIDAEKTGQVDEIVAELRLAKSHLDFGFYLLGMNDVIAEHIAHRHGVDTVTGIAQAANPEDLVMSTNDSARLFGSLIKEELTSAMERVRQITSGQAEMTELEKAAVRLGTVNSEILKAALNKTSPLDGAAFENINLKAVKEAGFEKLWSDVDVNKLMANVKTMISADVDTEVDTEVKAAINKTTINTDIKTTAKTEIKPEINANIAKKADVDFELPISAKELVTSKIRESVEAANRSASQSVEGMTAKFVAADNRIEIPISVLEFVNKKVVNNNSNNSNITQTGVDSTSVKMVFADESVEVPVSVLEAVGKKDAKDVKDVKVTPESLILNNAAVKKETTQSDVNTVKAESIEINKLPADDQQMAADKPSISNHQTVAKKPASSDNHNAHVAQQPSDHNLTIAGIENHVEIEDTAEDIDNQEQENITSINTVESKAAETLDKAERTFAPFTRFEQEAIIRQMTERMNHAVRTGAHEVRMILRPETLGEVRMSIRVEGDVVMARMQVENRQVKALVESNMQSLKDDLAKHNLNLGGFSVDVGSDNDRSMHEVWQEMAEKSGHRKFKADTDGMVGGSDNENDSHAVAAGSDTGRRFGNNTFEYFI
jgi:flagellar hook-length control protein FliK